MTAPFADALFRYADQDTDGATLSIALAAGTEHRRQRLEFIFGTPATVVVAAGGRLHLHWRLAQPARDPEARRRLEQATTAAAALVGGAPGSVHGKGKLIDVNADAELHLQAALSAVLDIPPEFRKATAEFRRAHSAAAGDGDTRAPAEPARARLARDDCHAEGQARAMTSDDRYQQHYARVQEVREENDFQAFVDSVNRDPGQLFEPHNLDIMAKLRRNDLPAYHTLRGDLKRCGNVDVFALDRAVDQLVANGPAEPASISQEALRARYWTLADIKNLAPPTWIIERLFASRTKALMFGESGRFKTMHLVDSLCRVAHGMDYHGLAVAASYPVCFIVNEDAYGFAVQRVQGWHLYHGRPDGRVIVMPANTKLDDPRNVELAIACARDAFGDERPIFGIDTWDRSINGNPNSTEDVNPALDGLDALLTAGELTVTASHSPWNDTNRTKGAVTFWANHETRIKAEKDQVTGGGLLDVLHHKNARAGLSLQFTFEQFDFKHCDVPTDTPDPATQLRLSGRAQGQDEECRVKALPRHQPAHLLQTA
jgi:hypothetical protein